MARVTIELRNCLKIQTFDLFDFDYGIIDVGWKEQLEADIIDYFYFHEIGQETIDRFKHTFKARLRLIMPYYNEIFKVKLGDLDPLLNQYIEETLEDNSSIQAIGGNISKTTFTDYPEHSDIKDDIATNKGSGESESTSSTSTAHDYRKIIKGYTGVNVSQLLIDYRKSIININQMIINDLKQCFILIY